MKNRRSAQGDKVMKTRSSVDHEGQTCNANGYECQEL